VDNSPKSDVEIFSAALNLPKHERAQFLDQAWGADGTLPKRVDPLLNANDEIGVFIENPFQVVPCVKRAAFTGGVKPGDRIGHFRVLEQIGQKGIIHRHIKPSNIFVTNGPEGMPH
jgi:eukaryotic-like serine/threonine-protein kinase